MRHLDVFEGTGYGSSTLRGLVGQFHTRSDGIAYTAQLDELRGVVGSPRAVTELEVTDRGDTRIFSGRARDVFRDVEYLLPANVVGLTMEGLYLARHIARLIDYGGPWACGLALEGLKGKPAYWENRSFGGQSFPEDDYEALALASYGDIERPQVIGWRLLGRFLRALRAESDQLLLTSLGLLPLED